MIRLAVLLLFTAAAGFAQGEMSDPEQQHLRQVLAQGSTSPVDLIRALETHLAKYPNSPKKDDLERALARAAVQAKDQRRIARYGVSALRSQPDDLTLLEPVCRALVSLGDPESAKTALGLSRHYEEIIQAILKQPDEGGPDRAKRKEELDRMLGQALLCQAIATHTLGDPKAAAELAHKSYQAFPSGESAAQTGKSLTQLGKLDDAVRAYADAFTITDSRGTDADRAAIRRRMGELYQRAHGSEKGLGEIVLEAYDRNTALMTQRRLALREFDPNLDVVNPMEFTLSGLDGNHLKLSTLMGKVIVMDFWATWCGPCRAQHPLYEQIKKKFADRPDVVFLSIDTDEDRAAVKPYLAQQGWNQTVYFEDGLQRTLRVTAIPTTIIINKRGELVSRMNGFDPESFVGVMIDRIHEALK